MPALNNIVSEINYTLNTKIFNAAKFLPCKLHGIAAYYEKKKEDGVEVQPFTTVDNVELRSMMFDDRNILQGYHVIKKLSYSNEDTFGKSQLIETAQMRFVLYGNLKRLKTTSPEIISSVVLFFKKRFDKVFLSDNKVGSVSVVVGDVEHNSISAWNSEFNDNDFPLKVNQFMAYVDYEIKTTYNENCFSSLSDINATVVEQYYGMFGSQWQSGTSRGTVKKIFRDVNGNLISIFEATNITWDERLTATYTQIYP